jgi:hypothetical protein
MYLVEEENSLFFLFWHKFTLLRRSRNDFCLDSLTTNKQTLSEMQDTKNSQLTIQGKKKRIRVIEGSD